MVGDRQVPEPVVIRSRRWSSHVAVGRPDVRGSVATRMRTLDESDVQVSHRWPRSADATRRRFAPRAPARTIRSHCKGRRSREKRSDLDSRRRYRRDSVLPRRGRKAYLALSRATGKEIVSCVITRGAEASHHLPGIGCGQADVLRSHLPEHYDETSTRSSAERRFVESTTLSMSGESASPPHVRRQFLGDRGTWPATRASRGSTARASTACSHPSR